MARGQIIVESTRLDNTADRVDTLANEYESEYTKLFGTVRELESAWAGADNVAFTTQIEGFRDDFQRMTQLMREYASYLRKAAVSYRETQDNLVAQAKTLSQGT